MSIAVIRTHDGWWAETPQGHVRVPTSATTTAELLADRAAVEAAASGEQPPTQLDGQELLSPVTAPCRVVAQMVNYRSHARDSGFDPDKVPPTFFRKTSGSITGPRATILRPEGVRLLDYEVEIGLVIGAPLPIGTVVTDANLAEYVAGLVIADDVSARDLQLPKTQFYESKSYPTFTPLGPRLVLTGPADLARWRELRLTLEVNGRPRQNMTAADMLTGPARALTLLARFQTLDPGDVLLTGTPGGTALRSPGALAEKVGALLPAHLKWKTFFRRQEANPAYLRDGDVVTARVRTDDGLLDLGEQRTPVGSARSAR
ncbi:fumarylacetoacetate hydrolase family protein [Actinocorallia sp. A-T 12471]|uniref:fumarylacetoacetate hydrolase family protein n=1 Tax=Actinocorallia sp. A-T 12471 TaxID=3089813 RepID=UPI0029CF69B0|nr:fumarylacetoacetate hydrolase family protein [Actinocorallia sp. A-T 12471]MDX6740150.1 fumarylacetoacetate hydrolase family protein [Actinocorallia sp. A-T 12471]